MTFIKMSKFLVLIFTMVLLTSNLAHLVPNVSAIGAYASTAPTIDGSIGVNEWQNAETVDLDLGEHDGFNYFVKVYVMNDLENLYMAFEIDDPNPSQSILGLYFDDDHDSIPDDGVLFNPISSNYEDCWVTFGHTDPHQDGEMTSTIGAEKNYFELSKPLLSEDTHDIEIYKPGPIHFFMYYWRSGGMSPVLWTPWELIDIESPLNIVILNVRKPDQVEVDQTVFVTVEVGYELLPPDTRLRINLEEDPGPGLGMYGETVRDNGTATHTFEITAPPAPTTWHLMIYTFAHALANDDQEGITIEVKDDLEITPDVEGICIWDGPPPPETAPPSEQIEIPIEVKYAVTYDAWIVTGIYDEEGSLVSSVEFDERVSGIGSNDYIFEVTTPDTEGLWSLKASLYYGHVVGVDSVHEECDEWPFTLIITSGVPGGEGVNIIDVASLAEVNSGDEVQVDVNVEYELPAGAKYRVSILDSTSSLIIKTSDEATAASHGFETFNFDGIYAPFTVADTIFTLRAVAEYKTDGDWQILDPEGQEEFQITVLGVQISPGDLPVAPPIPPLPIPPDSLPPTPEDFDFTLSLTPDSQEVSPGQTVSYEVELQGSIEETQLVTLGVSGQPLGSTVNIIPLAGTPTYSSTLTITLGDSVQPESYTITVNASGGEKTHSQSASLIVKSPPDFSISISTPEVTVEQGESTSIDINIEPLHGFNTPVNLAVTTSPNGVEAKLNPESETPAFTSRIEIIVENDMAAGTYPLIITAEGSAQKSSQVRLSVEAPRQTAAATQPQFPYGMFALIVIILLIVAAILAFRRRKTKATAPPTAPMKFCIECGVQIPIDTLHCPKCGVKQQ
jgi:hypothetical protein